MLALAGVGLLACGASAQSLSTSGLQGYPNRPVQIIVPFTPGTGMDILARTVGHKLSERWEQPVVVDNRPGASGNIGTELVVKAAPDGYTLLMSVNTLVMNVSLYRNLPYDPIRDLAPVERMAVGTLAVTLNPAVPARSLKEFVAYAKANPGKLAYGSPGVGTPQHLATELFKSTAGIDMLHVPYKGSAGAITGLLAGDVVFMFNALHAVLPQIKAGKLKAIATTYDTRITAYPDIPTTKEQGYPGVKIGHWAGLFAPKGTPQPILDKMSRELLAVVKSKDFQDKLIPQGIEPAPYSVPAYVAFINAERERLGKIAKSAKMQAD